MAYGKRTYTKRTRRSRPKKATGSKKTVAKYYRPRINRPISGNYFTLRCRVPFTILRSQMSTLPDNSLQFNFVNAPWRNLNTDTSNRLYHTDFVQMEPLYQQYKLGKIEYCIRRPNQFINQTQTQGGDMTIRPTVSFGTQVLHSTQMMAADGVSNVIQGSVNYTPRVLLRVPNSWTEAVDNQDRRFKVHGYKTFVKRTWLPATGFEKHWRSTVTETEQDVGCGGLTIMVKNKNMVPEYPEEQVATQVMFEGYADVYMNYCRRT